jgi:hypothetical protein
MRRNHKRFLCEVCISFTHAQCSGAAGTNLKQIRADTPVTWTWDRCILSTLPFHACPELDYVAIEGYITKFRHCEVTKGEGVGAYVKDNIPYKLRYDIENTQPGMEHLWLELPGQNKHSKLLLGVIYRSNLLITASNWLECFEDLLTMSPQLGMGWLYLPEIQTLTF